MFIKFFINKINYYYCFISLQVNYRIGSKDSHSGKEFWVKDNIDIREEYYKSNRLNKIDKDKLSLWPPHCIVNTTGFELLPGLPHPETYDYFVYKGIDAIEHPYGACYRDSQSIYTTGLIEFLQVHNITHLIVGGLSTDYCVKTTLIQLVNSNIYKNSISKQSLALYIPATKAIDQNCLRPNSSLLQEFISMGITILYTRDELDRYQMKATS